MFGFFKRPDLIGAHYWIDPEINSELALNLFQG